MNSVKSIWAIFMKDVRSELRVRYAINTLGMFTFVSVICILFALQKESAGSEVLSGMFWIVIFFTAMSGLSRIFISEEEKGTSMILQLVSLPHIVYLGKLLFNSVLTILLSFMVTILYVIVFPIITVRSAGIFLFTVILGSIGFAATSTIMAAIISRTQSKGTLFTVLSFPILAPLLLTVIGSTVLAMEGEDLVSAASQFEIMAGYILIVIGISYMMFDYIWKE